MSGLETACWDICKAVGKPVYELLGGNGRNPQLHLPLSRPVQGLDVYADTRLRRPRRCRGGGRQGGRPRVHRSQFQGLHRRRPHADAQAFVSEEFCKAIREAVGDRADLLFGTHGQFTAAGAIRLAQRIEYDPLWFEEPTPPENVDEMAKVARGTSIPVATGERLTTKYEFHRVLEAGAAAILQPALGRSGGILETKKIAAIAEAYYAQLAPHLYCGPIEALANIQLSACIPNFLILESITTSVGSDELLTRPIEWVDGYVILEGTNSTVTSTRRSPRPIGTGTALHPDEDHPNVPDELTCRVPHVPLASLPTPLEACPDCRRHSEVLLWVKRDDQTGLAMGGNKARKLEYLIADAERRCRWS